MTQLAGNSEILTLEDNGTHYYTSRSALTSRQRRCVKRKNEVVDASQHLEQIFSPMVGNRGSIVKKQRSMGDSDDAKQHVYQDFGMLGPYLFFSLNR